MNRSPHASYLHPNWGEDALWHAGIGIPITSDDVKSVIPSLVGIPVPPIILPPKIQLPVVRSECYYLGSVITRVGCSTCRRADTRVCNHPKMSKKHVTQNRDCESCSVWESLKQDVGN